MKSRPGSMTAPAWIAPEVASTKTTRTSWGAGDADGRRARGRFARIRPRGAAWPRATGSASRAAAEAPGADGLPDRPAGPAIAAIVLPSGLHQSLNDRGVEEGPRLAGRRVEDAERPEGDVEAASAVGRVGPIDATTGAIGEKATDAMPKTGDRPFAAPVALRGDDARRAVGGRRCADVADPGGVRAHDRRTGSCRASPGRGPLRSRRGASRRGTRRVPVPTWASSRSEPIQS